jgi:ABC-type sugar transport system permease subunit
LSTGISVGATVPLSLGIGMSLHWPVIGWMFGRTILFSLHTAVRAAAVIAPWHVFPQDRFTLIPLAIAAVYLVTALAIAIGIARLRSAK